MNQKTQNFRNKLDPSSATENPNFEHAYIQMKQVSGHNVELALNDYADWIVAPTMFRPKSPFPYFILGKTNWNLSHFYICSCFYALFDYLVKKRRHHSRIIFIELNWLASGRRANKGKSKQQ